MRGIRPNFRTFSEFCQRVPEVRRGIARLHFVRLPVDGFGRLAIAEDASEPATLRLSIRPWPSEGSATVMQLQRVPSEPGPRSDLLLSETISDFGRVGPLPRHVAPHAEASNAMT